MPHPLLIVPGIGNSDALHWQSLWQAQAQTLRQPCLRTQVRDWDAPELNDWVAAIARGVAELGPQTVVVAHSLGCLALAHWAVRTQGRVHAALLVAAPDPAGPAFPPQAASFANAPMTALPFNNVLVASDDDPYASMAYAQQCATAWGSRLVRAGALGHINAASGLGDWPAGRALLAELTD